MPASEQSPINFAPDDESSMHPAYAVVFCLNYMMGSGYLTLPRAFADAGLAWGLSVLAVVAIGAMAAAECLLDCMARAGWIAAARALPEGGGSFCRVPLDAPSPKESRFQREAPRPVQLPDLCALYLGDMGYAAYVTLISGYMLGSLWCYAAIFAAALEANIGPHQVLYVSLFALFVVPLSLKDLADQKTVQTLLAFGRVVMLLVMLVTALTCLYTTGPLAPMPARTGTFDGVGALAPVVTFSLVLHHSVPQIVAPVKIRREFDKNVVFRRAFLVACVLYALFAAPVAYLFGDSTKSAANLGWATYHHVHDASDPRDVLKSHLIYYLGQFVVLYPAVNVLATYPLNVITFGDALLAAHRRFKENGEVSSLPPSRRSVRVARLCAAIPPLVGACIQPDISRITNVTGCFGLFLCAVVPGVLALAARKLAPGPTEHASLLNGRAAATLLVVAGGALTAGSLVAAL